MACAANQAIVKAQILCPNNRPTIYGTCFSEAFPEYVILHKAEEALTSSCPTNPLNKIK